jgi:hypothetical protein
MVVVHTPSSTEISKQLAARVTEVAGTLQSSQRKQKKNWPNKS